MKGINKEIDFENRIRDILTNDIFSHNKKLGFLNFRKSTDILVYRNGDDADIFFIEIKYYDKSHGRLGFGHAGGKGFQPEVLRKNPDFFKSNMRWILGSIDKNKYYFLSNEEILRYVSGGVIGYKQNNIQTKIFDEIRGLTMNELITELKKWFNK